MGDNTASCGHEIMDVNTPCDRSTVRPALGVSWPVWKAGGASFGL